MSRKFLLATAGAVGLLALGAPDRASAGPCGNVTLDVWLAIPGFTCTVGNLIFGNFSYNPDGTGVPAMNLGVGPDTLLGLSGLQFNGFFNNTTGANEDALLIFSVTAAPGTPLISDFHLQLDGAVGNVNDRATITSGSSVFTIGATDNTLQTLNFPTPLQTLTVQDDIGVGPGGTVSSIHKGFSAVPGPIMGAGLPGLVAAFGLLALARRRRKLVA
jgi:hypothetical protein